jgi:hypothetical protein
MFGPQTPWKQTDTVPCTEPLYPKLNIKLCKYCARSTTDGVHNKKLKLHTNILCNIQVTFIIVISFIDHLCGLVVGVPGYRYRDPGFDSLHYQIF